MTGGSVVTTEQAQALLEEAIAIAKQVQRRHANAPGLRDYTDLGWVVGKLRRVRDVLSVELSVKAVT